MSGNQNEQKSGLVIKLTDERKIDHVYTFPGTTAEVDLAAYTPDQFDRWTDKHSHFDKRSGQRNSRVIDNAALEKEMLEHVVLDWRNFCDEEGNPIPFKKDDIVKVLKRMPPEYYRDFFDFVMYQLKATTKADPQR